MLLGLISLVDNTSKLLQRKWRFIILVRTIFLFIGNFLPLPLTVLKSADPRGRARISKLPYNVFPFAFKKWGKAERIEGISHTDAIHRFVEKIIYNTNNFNDCLLLIQ